MESGLAVDGDVGEGVVIDDIDLKGPLVVEDEAAVAEGVGADGGNDDDLGGPVDNGAAGREVVGGGSGGSGDDDAVANGFVNESVFIGEADVH